MKNSNKIAEKLVKIREWCSLLVMMFGNVFRVQGPGCITKYGNILKNSQKIRKKWGMIPIVGDDVYQCIQGPGCITKYGNIPENSQKIRKKSEKIEG
jgi:hypothetical protein